MNRLVSALVLLGLLLPSAPAVSSAAVAPSTVTLTPKGETGEPLEVSGVVYESDGKTPAIGVKVLAYHTDAKGHYSEGGQDRERAKFSGTATTGRDGAYRFRTIWPGPYPGGRTPRHVHFELTAADGRRSSSELQFADDPILDSDARAAGRAATRRGDRFHEVQEAPRGSDGVRRARFDLKLHPRGR